jgi:aminotransferase
MKSTLSQRVQAVPPSGIRKYFDIAATMQDVISLSIGEPDFVTPDVIRRAGIQSIERGETKYTSNSGTIELRTALSDHLAKRYGVRYDAETEILITVGVSEALQIAMLATIDPGDQVIVPEPCFVAYKPSIIFCGGEPIVVDTYVENDFQVTGADIERAITPRTKGILIGYPNNPTGAVMSRERLLEVARVAEQHDLLVFSDEIYDRLVYGVEHVCFAALPGMRDRTILLGGFSKDYAMTGWRVGLRRVQIQKFWVRFARCISTSSCPRPTMGQAGALAGLLYAEQDVQAMIRSYDQRRQVTVSGLRAIGLPTFTPRGAFYAFPDIRGTGLTSEAILRKVVAGRTRCGDSRLGVWCQR